MKKNVLAALLFLTVSVTVSAQATRFIDNTFVTIGGGVNFYGNDKGLSNAEIGWPSFDLAAGKWVFNPVALRVGVSGFRATNDYFISDAASSGTIKSSTGIPGLGDSIATASTLFTAIHADLVWDVRTSFSGLQSRTFNVYPFVGFGLVRRGANPYMASDRDFVALAGLDLDWAFAPETMPGWKLFLQGKMFFLSQAFDQNESFSNLIDLQAGLKYDINATPYRHRVAGQSRFFADDWYIGFGAGLNMAQTHAFNTFETNLQPVGDLTLGKYFTTFLSARLQGNLGMAALSPDTSFTYYNIHGDFLFDVLNIKVAVRNRPVSVLPYVGAGVINRTDDSRMKVSADFGAYLRLYLDKHSDLFFDLRYVLAHARFIRDFDGVGGHAYNFGIPSITFGYVRALGVNNCR